MMPLGRTILAFGAIAVTGVFATPRAVAQELRGEGENPGLSIIIQGLKRDASNSVTLRFQIVNDSDTNFANHGEFREEKSAYGDISAVHLIDNVNKKKYLVVRDSTGKCACADLNNVDKGKRVNLWAKLAAPPENVEKVTVIVPKFQPVDDVPITR